MAVTKSLLDNGKIQVVKTEEIERYEGRIFYSQSNVDFAIEDFKTNNKCWAIGNSREGFDVLDTGENWEPGSHSVAEDITHFQLYLDKTYGVGRYEAFALGAYIHSGVSFSISKGADTRDKWDSGTIGFIGIPKESIEYYKQQGLGINHYASFLSDAWNGCLGEMIVWDNYNEDVVDSIWTTDPIKTINEWKERMKEEYGVENYKEEY